MTVSNRLHTRSRRKTTGMNISFTSTFCTVLATVAVRTAWLDCSYIAIVYV